MTDRELCWCCGEPLQVTPAWWDKPYPYCGLCDGGPNVMTSPPHVCEKNDRLITDEHKGDCE